MKKKDNYLYKCKSTLDEYVYKKIVRNFPDFYLHYITIGTILNIIITLFFVVFHRVLNDVIIMLIVNEMIIMIYFKIRLEKIAEKQFKKMKKNVSKFESTVIFYDTYLNITNDVSTITVKYDEITKCIETKEDFLIKYNKYVLPIQKRNCTKELIEYIRRKPKKIIKQNK